MNYAFAMSIITLHLQPYFYALMRRVTVYCWHYNGQAISVASEWDGGLMPTFY